MWDAASRRYGGNSTYEYTTNTLIEKACQSERNRGISADIGFGNDVDDYVEFAKISEHHLEATTAGGTIGALSSRPQYRIGNVRGFDLTVPFFYGGSGPLIHYEKLRDAAASKMTGVNINFGNMLGYLENHAVVAGKTPERLIDLVRGDDVNIIGTEMDTALSEHIRIRSTFGPNVAIAGVKHKTRAGATTNYIVDDRADTEAARKPFAMWGFLSEGWSYIYKKAAASILWISSDTGFAAQIRFRVNGISRWDAGINTDGDFEITRRSTAGANLGSALKILTASSATAGLLATVSKSGVPSDADYTTPPPIGTMVVDTANARLYVRTGSATWKYTALI